MALIFADLTNAPFFPKTNYRVQGQIDPKTPVGQCDYQENDKPDIYELMRSLFTQLRAELPLLKLIRTALLSSELIHSSLMNLIFCILQKMRFIRLL